MLDKNCLDICKSYSQIFATFATFVMYLSVKQVAPVIWQFVKTEGMLQNCMVARGLDDAI